MNLSVFYLGDIDVTSFVTVSYRFVGLYLRCICIDKTSLQDLLNKFLKLLIIFTKFLTFVLTYLQKRMKPVSVHVLYMK